MRTAGRLEETMSNGPRYFVGRVRTSMVLSPAAIRLAHGCRMERAFMVVLRPPPCCGSGSNRAVRFPSGPVKTGPESQP